MKQVTDRGEVYRMELGRKPPFGWTRDTTFDCIRNYPNSNDRYWGKPFEKFHDRIATRQRYKTGPHPWAPGRYNSARWLPYSGYGRFSGLREMMQGQYYAERYTGVRLKPDDYFIGRASPEWIEADRVKRWRNRSWQFDLAT